MNRILQAQENAKLQFQKAIQPGRPTGVFMTFEGVNAAATTATAADLGTLTFKRNGRTIVNRSVQSVIRMMDIRQGSNLFVSEEAGTFVATVFVPFFEEGIPQSLNVKGSSELVIGYSPKSASLDKFASLNVSVYSVEGYRSVPEYYEFYILGDDQDVSGAVDKPYQLNDNHITAVYLEDPDSIVAEAGFSNNNGQVISSQSWNTLLGGTLMENRLETTDFDMVELQLFSKSEPSSYLNRKNTIQIESNGAGDVLITKCFMIPNERFTRDLLK